MRIDRDSLFQMVGLFAMLFGGKRKFKLVLGYVADAIEGYDTIRDIRQKIAVAAQPIEGPDGQMTNAKLVLTPDEVASARAD